MKLYTVGPCQMFDRTLEIGKQQVPYFRNQEFSDIYLDSEKLFKEFVGCKPEDKFIPLTASGTAAMEATLLNCLHDDDKALVIVGGTFGRRFSQLCDILEIAHDDVVLADGAALTREDLVPFEDGGHTALLVNLDETSTGQLYDIDMLSDFCRERGMFLVVDAIGAFAADKINVSEMSIGALITSSQKGLSLPPGMAFVFIEKNAYDQRVEGHKIRSMYFDFKDYILNGVRGQTPFTPAVSIMIQLQDILHAVRDDGGIDVWIQRTADIARDFRARLEELPISIPDYPLSNAVTPIIFEDADAGVVNARLVDEYGFVLNPCGGANASRMSRVAHIGNHTIEDNIELIDALKAVLDD